MVEADRSNSTPRLEHAIAKRVTSAFVLGLILIAVLAGTIHFLLDHIIAEQRDAGTIINIAGRQRMLSQRIALLAADLRSGDTDAREPLMEAVAMMRRSQDALIAGDDLGIIHSLSPSALQLYFDQPEPLDPLVRDFLQDATHAALRADGQANNDAYRSLELHARGTLLRKLNQATGLFESEANDRIEHLRTVQQAVLATLLVTLALEAMFIFRPLVRQIRIQTESLFELATRDGLTGLANRSYFMDRAAWAVRQASHSGQSLTAIMIDLDRFKSVNDTYGHGVGDLVLRRFAVIAALAIRAGDLLGRIGGEEFALVLPATGLSAAIVVAERLRVAVGADRTVGQPNFTISVGISVLELEDKSIDDLLKRADGAVYSAKRQGRDCVIAQYGGAMSVRSPPIPAAIIDPCDSSTGLAVNLLVQKAL